MLTLIVLCQLDRVTRVEMIDGGELATIRAHDRHVVLDLGHCFPELILSGERSDIGRHCPAAWLSAGMPPSPSIGSRAQTPIVPG